MMLDFTRAWRDAFFPLLSLNKIEDTLLASGEHGDAKMIKFAMNASSNEHGSTARLCDARALFLATDN
jgi:hypothetical protein